LLAKVRVAEADPEVEGLKVTVNGTDWPAGIVSAREIPLRANAVLLVPALVMVILAPLAVKVPEAVPLVPTTTLPTARVVGETLSCPAGVMPVPVRVAVVVGGWASLLKVRVADAEPGADGLNVTVNGEDWPAGIVRGSEIPLTANAVLLVPALVMVTLAPLAVKVPDAVPLLPTVTLPTVRVMGETLSCPAVVVPVPDKAIVRVGSDAFDVTVRAPDAAPAAVGTNEMLMVAFVPGARVNGRLATLTVNALLLIPI
jgi:cytochrome c biogenesis factor